MIKDLFKMSLKCRKINKFKQMKKINKFKQIKTEIL